MNLSERETESLALKYYVHRAEETASAFVRYAKEIREVPGITFGCRVLDTTILPIRPGRTLGILARPGHAKTSLIATILKNEAHRLAQLPDFGGRYALHVSWEQSVEEIESMYQADERYSVSDVAWGKVPIDQVIEGAIKRPRLPVWIFGESIYQSEFDAPPMTIDMVYAGVRAAYREWGMLPSVIALDYIQDVPVPDERERTMQVASATRQAKRLGLHAKCPIIMGVQASRESDYQPQFGGKVNPIPTMKDAQHSSVIEQKLDCLFAVWRPIRTWLPQEEPTIKVGGIEYENNSNLCVIKLLKQRFEKGEGIWGVHFDPARLELKDYGTVKF